MGNANQSRGTRVFLRYADFGLLLLFILSSTLGLEWLTMCPHIQASDENRVESSKETLESQMADASMEQQRRSVERNRKEREAAALEKKVEEAQKALPDLAGMKAQRDQVTRELGACRNQAAGLKESLQKLDEQYGASEEDRKRLEEERKELEQQLDELEKKLEDLLKRQKDLGKEKQRIETFQENIAETDQQLKDAQDANRQAQDQIDVMSRPAVPKDFLVETTPRFQAERDREAVFVLINQGTVTPVIEPYYRITKEPNGATRKSLSYRGDNAPQSLAAGSEFIKFLDGINKRKQYIFMVVDSKSFETFRTIRAELRRRQIDCGWEPSNAVNFRFSSTGQSPGTS